MLDLLLGIQKLIIKINDPEVYVEVVFNQQELYIYIYI